MSNQFSTKLLTVFLFFSQIHGIWAQMGSVYYGERKLEMDQSALFLDKEGWWYPAIRIEDDSLRNAGSLKNWYARHPADFGKLAEKYYCHFSDWSEENAVVLNDSICQERARFWSNSGTKSLTFLVHGFRKTFHPRPHERDSPNDFQILRKALQASGAETGTVVEVYWDGTYGCCFSASPARNRPLFRLFETAALQAETAGKSLGIFLARLPTRQIGLISHSLGAKLVLQALESPGLTKAQKKDLRLCLIGPAIGPDVVLKMLENRQQQGHCSQLRIDLVYNEEDFVLRKKDPKLGLFGPGPKKYGDTRLGCNAGNVAQKLENKIKGNFSSLTFEIHNLTSVGGCHHIWCYTRNGILNQVFKSCLENEGDPP